MVRDGGRRIRLLNSGRDVWLFDDSHCELIQRSGAMHFGAPGADIRFRAIAKDGVLLGYGLDHDDELDVEVLTGQPLRDDELAGARWFPPQHAWIRLPSGILCINSSDTVLAEIWRASKQGARADVGPGNYIVSLYRVDYAAMDRERRRWDGPREVIVLTRGGSSLNAVPCVLQYPGLTRVRAS
jgi:hypothetical protein